MPQRSQTSSIPPALGTRRLISDGCTKIDAPMMMPTTMAVARNSPMDRVRLLIRSIIVTLFLSVATAYGQCVEPLWTAGPLIPRAGIGGDPFSVLAGDFDGDLRPDIVLSANALA